MTDMKSSESALTPHAKQELKFTPELTLKHFG